MAVKRNNSRWRESPLLPLAGIFAIALVLTFVRTPLLVGSGHAHGAGAIGHTDEYPVHADFRIVQNGVAWTQTDLGLTGFQHAWQLPDNAEREVSDHIAHVKTNGQPWNEFFASLGVQLDSRCILAPDPGKKVCSTADGAQVWQLVVNGQPQPWNPARPIQDLDRALFYYGPPGAATQPGVFERFVTNESCVYEGSCNGEVAAERC
ncbi:Uncharacterised protein [uncultured archaeon]|nr:Uncharacterised protein [uncultured archaeon]